MTYHRRLSRRGAVRRARAFLARNFRYAPGRHGHAPRWWRGHVHAKRLPGAWKREWLEVWP